MYYKPFFCKNTGLFSHFMQVFPLLSGPGWWLVSPLSFSITDVASKVNCEVTVWYHLQKLVSYSYTNYFVQWQFIIAA